MDNSVTASTVWPLVSIVMPAYNAQDFIAESIQSVINQTYSNWELIVIDDGSTDNTKEEVLNFVQKDKRIKYFYQENLRQSRARNNGIEKATGDYIAFLDSDDLWFPNKLRIQVPAILQNKVDLVFADAVHFKDRYDASSNYELLGAGKGIFRGETGLKDFLLINKIPAFTVLTKKTALNQVGNFTVNPKFPNAEDYHLWLKMLINGCSFLGLPEVVGAYRIHSSSVSSEDRACLPFVVEAKAELYRNSAQYKSALYSSLKTSIVKNLDFVQLSRPKEIFRTIRESLYTADKKYLLPLFNLLERFKKEKIALRLAYFIFNYF